MSNITGQLTDMQLVLTLMLMLMSLSCLSKMLLLEVKNIFGIVMMHHIIRKEWAQQNC